MTACTSWSQRWEGGGHCRTLLAADRAAKCEVGSVCFEPGQSLFRGDDQIERAATLVVGAAWPSGLVALAAAIGAVQLGLVGGRPVGGVQQDVGVLAGDLLQGSLGAQEGQLELRVGGAAPLVVLGLGHHVAAVGRGREGVPAAHAGDQR